MTLGTLCNLYSNTADRKVTDAVACSFSVKKDELTSWSKTVTEVRNLCAHLEPFIVRRQVPAVPKRLMGIDANRRSPFYALLVFERLLHGMPLPSGEDYVGGLGIRADLEHVIEAFERRLGGSIPIQAFPRDWRLLLEKAASGSK